MDHQLLRQKVRQRISIQTHSMFPENWHYNSRSVLKTTKTSVFVFITEILNELFEVIKDDLFVFDVAKNLY